jgi:hypothetical protein
LNQARAVPPRSTKCRRVGVRFGPGTPKLIECILLRSDDTEARHSQGEQATTRRVPKLVHANQQ